MTEWKYCPRCGNGEYRMSGVTNEVCGLCRMIEEDQRQRERVEAIKAGVLPHPEHGLPPLTPVNPDK